MAKQRVIGIFTTGNPRRTDAQIRAARSAGYVQPVLFIKPGDTLSESAGSYESVAVENQEAAEAYLDQRYPKLKTRFFNHWNHGEPQQSVRPIKQLAVVTCLFNPGNDPRREQNIRTMREALGVPLVVVELSFDDRFVFEDSIQIRGNHDNVMWQKERLLNIAFASLPAECDAVAWIDADMLFENPDWYSDAKGLLAVNDFVQLFDRVDYLKQDGTNEKSYPGWVSAWGEQRMPGGAWAARRDQFKSLPDTHILGGGDWAFVNSLPAGARIDCVAGTVKHLYHGSLPSRRHGERTKILERHQFDPTTDLKRDDNGLWSWGSDKPELHQDVREYFQARNQEAGLVESAYDIDVFMPYCNNLHLVPQAIDAVLWQCGVKPFLHLVNDCSPEDDAELKQRYGHLDNIAWYQTKNNCGPYAIANSLFHYMQTEFIGIADSDDVLLPHHYETALKDLQEHNADAWGSSMSSFLSPLEDHTQHAVDTLDNHKIVDSGRDIGMPYPRLVNGTMVIRKKTFQDLNGYNGDWHCGADAEFSQRLQFPSDVKAKVYFSDQVTALRRICSNSLTNSSNKYGLNSPERKQIRSEREARFKAWSKAGTIEPRKYGTLDSQEDVLVLDNQVKQSARKQELPLLVTSVRDTRRNKKVTACLASIPSRETALEKTVASLINQVDALKIHLNGYPLIPSFLDHPKIEVVQGTNLLGGNTKFYFVDHLQGYVFTCDDDILYPPNYVDEMQRGINTYRCLVGASGNSVCETPPVKSYLKALKNHPLQREVPEDTDTDLIGTGTLGWHTEDVRLKFSDIIYRNMIDISLLRVALRDRIPRKIIRHPDRWLTRTTDDHGLHEMNLADDSESTQTINEVLATYPKKVYSGKRITVSLINFKRSKNTHRIIDCLRKQTVPPVIHVWNNGAEPFENPHADLIINSNRNTHAHCSRFLCQYADTEFLCRMDDDLMLGDERVLEDVIRFMESHGKSQRIVGGYGVILQDGKRYDNSKHVGCGKLYKPVTCDTPVDIIKGRIMFMRQEFAETIPLDTSHVHIDLTTSFALSGQRRLFHIVPAFLDDRIIELPDDHEDGSGRGYSFMEGHLDIRNKLTEEWRCSLQ